MFELATRIDGFQEQCFASAFIGNAVGVAVNVHHEDVLVRLFLSVRMREVHPLVCAICAHNVNH